jgi:hypothetical protein
MIQPLRTVHRRAFVLLAWLLPAILLAGLGMRRPRLQPAAGASQVPASAHLMKASGALWQKHAIRSEFYSEPGAPQEGYVVLRPEQTVDEPDLLLYWAEDAPPGNALPPRARLLGSFAAGKVFILPVGSERAGHLVLFSLAHQRIFDSTTGEKLP